MKIDLVILVGSGLNDKGVLFAFLTLLWSRMQTVSFLRCDWLIQMRAAVTGWSREKEASRTEISLSTSASGRAAGARIW